METGFIKSQGVNISYIANTLHQNRISLLFVPGIMMSAQIWEKQLKYFATHYNVVAMDPRCHGDSGQTSEGLYALSMAKDIQAVIETLDLKSVILVGWSLGVPQVVNYAAKLDTERLIGLVLVDGIVGADPSLPFYKSMVDQWIGFQMDRIPTTKKFIKIIFAQPHKDDFLEKLNKIALEMPTNTVMNLITNYILQDFRPLLRTIKVPTWIATIPGPRLDYMKEMHRLLPNSDMQIFEEAGHALFVDQPDTFNSSLEAFIKGI